MTSINYPQQWSCCVGNVWVHICRTSIHTSLSLECLVIKMWIVECESCVTSRLLCYLADENINKQMICFGTKANIVDLAVRILGHLDISVGAFHLLYSFNVWPFKSYDSAVTRVLCDWNAHCSTDFPFVWKDLCLMEQVALFVWWRLNDQQKDLLFVQIIVV